MGGIEQATAQSSGATQPDFNARFKGLERTAPVFTYPEVQSHLSAGKTGEAPAGEPHTTAAVPSGGPAARTVADRSKPIERGRATWYQHPGRTAAGERYNPDGLTAAHRSLPFGKRVLVVNTQNGRSVVVRITDRTNERTRAKRPYVVDLSRGSARALGIEGVAQVALYEAR
ncbi:septal ring lytic transglycosylase RlpA family protein [Methylobacterium sp. A54F]